MLPINRRRRAEHPPGRQNAAGEENMVYRMIDVAERAGVSVATVSHFLNKTRYISPETQQRVLEVIQELNYHKNAHARRLAQSRSDLFGLIISEKD